MVPWNDYSEAEKLLQTVVSPISKLTGSEEQRFSISKSIVDENYFELDDFIDGELRSNPVFICHTDRENESAFTVFRLLHNYLSALYSFNEHVMLLVNEKTPSTCELKRRHFIPDKDQTNVSEYARKVGFLTGIRTDCQHSDFSSLDFDQMGSVGDFGAYHLVFKRDKFVNSSLRDPQKFLHHTNQAERNYPLSLIAMFHENEFNRFYHDCISWLR